MASLSFIDVAYMVANMRNKLIRWHPYFEDDNNFVIVGTDWPDKINYYTTFTICYDIYIGRQVGKYLETIVQTNMCKMNFLMVRLI